MHKETVRCKDQIEQLQKTIADKQKVLEDVMDQRDRFNKENYKLHRELEDVKKSNEYLRGTLKNYEDRVAELENDKEYWVERSEKMQLAYSDLRWLFDNQPVVEKQTARKCLNIVTKIKNDPLTAGSTYGEEWMVAVCEDIEREIKKDFDLR
jgi:chromosome segregation ATPase